LLALPFFALHCFSLLSACFAVFFSFPSFYCFSLLFSVFPCSSLLFTADPCFCSLFFFLRRPLGKCKKRDRGGVRRRKKNNEQKQGSAVKSKELQGKTLNSKEKQ
jgi:hypothetical protein